MKLRSEGGKSIKYEREEKFFSKFENDEADDKTVSNVFG